MELHNQNISAMIYLNYRVVNQASMVICYENQGRVSQYFYGGHCVAVAI